MGVEVSGSVADVRASGSAAAIDGVGIAVVLIEFLLLRAYAGRVVAHASSSDEIVFRLMIEMHSTVGFSRKFTLFACFVCADEGKTIRSLFGWHYEC